MVCSFPVLLPSLPTGARDLRTRPSSLRGCDGRGRGWDRRVEGWMMETDYNSGSATCPSGPGSPRQRDGGQRRAVVQGTDLHETPSPGPVTGGKSPFLLSTAFSSMQCGHLVCSTHRARKACGRLNHRAFTATAPTSRGRECWMRSSWEELT